MTFCCFVFITVTLSLLACAASLKCFNCTGVTHMDDCQNKTKCGKNEVCFTQRQYSGQISYDLGCMDSEKCGNVASLPSGISRIDTSQENTNPCFECCSRKNCNSQLCQYKDPDVCVDDERVDCAFLNSLFKLCEDINQAKKVCPKYCKLCQLVDGNWTPWSNCDVTCENGTQIRTSDNDTETKSCQMGPCPIHGGWNTWSTWSECSVSCDIGMQHRDRSCTNPRPSLSGDHCFGNSREDKICMPGACADGGWSAWGSWGPCSKSCASGNMSRNRTCSNPVPSITGKQCMGNFEQISVCNTQECQVDGNWTAWSNCDVTCENGTQIRTRGNDTETKSCHKGPCPINGGWNTWSTWSECSVSCDIGMQHRDRLCTNPRPSLFGDHCFGTSRDDRICMPGACADGGWSAWGSWGTCSKSCASGIMSKNRTCSNPVPSITGKQCMGNFEQISACNTQACQDGGWSNWGSWGTCSVSCAGGIMSRNRECSNPAPSLTGKQCMGNSEQVSLCNKQACKDGGWSAWGRWGTCSVSCSGGIMSRNRACSNPAPSMTGKQCMGNSEQVSLCNKQACKDGGWSSWGRWGTCSKSCAGGTMSRNRACSNPAPSLIGKQCMGNSEQVGLCNTHACQDGGWSAWGRWGTCSVSCSGGIMSRNRACSNPAPSLTGKQCMGNSEQVSLCNKQSCKDGGWSSWGRWGTCSKSCAGGTMSRNRACSNPAPSITGKQCLGNSEQASLCNQQACQEHNVAFTVYNVLRNSRTSTTVKFLNTYINYGSGYSTITGEFTCKVPGVYHFVVSLLLVFHSNYIQAYLRINGNNKLQLHFQPKPYDNNVEEKAMVTGAGTYHLDKNDVVTVYGASYYFYGGQWSSFTGFLITPDQ